MNSCAPLRSLLITLSLIASIATSGCFMESSHDCADENDANGCPSNEEVVDCTTSEGQEDCVCTGEGCLTNSSIVMPDVIITHDGGN